MFILQIALGVVLGLLLFWGVVVFARGGWRISLAALLVVLTAAGKFGQFALLLMALYVPILIGLEFLPEDMSDSIFVAIPTIVYLFAVLFLIDPLWKKLKKKKLEETSK